MQIAFYVIAGLIGGILGGMGMGGGTLLIPLLTLFFSVSQHVAQAVNLIAFIPMAVVAFFIHKKNGLIELKDMIFLVVSGLVLCVAGSLVAKIVDGKLLGRFFGLFLIVLSFFQVLTFKEN